ncbi:MAG: hypothetical protein AAFQ80_05500 [Cyanobacteria bacterium J06621_8]
MVNLLLAEAFVLVVPTSATRDMNLSDLEKLMAIYGVLEIARDDFLKGEITFQEYCDLQQTHGVNVDSFLKTTEHNLKELQLI